MSVVQVGLVQMAMVEAQEQNIAAAVAGVRQAAADGAQVILLPELFEGFYFPREIDDRFFAWAKPLISNPAVHALKKVCAELEVVVPVSVFEYDPVSTRYYNTVVVVDADGQSLGFYRKTHIPDGPGYEEKHYFSPGDTGFKVFSTKYGRLGVGICWDQWFPECARAMTLQGADLLLYPTAIGSEPEPPYTDTSAAWQRVMQGHAVANTIPVMAANRVGDEGGQRFYGHSFVCDGFGELLVELPADTPGVRVVPVDLGHWSQQRDWMGLLRDRRPNCYR